MNHLSKLMRSTRAATAIEYGLIIALIFLAAVVAMGNVGTATSSMWNHVSTTTNEAIGK